MGETPGGIFFQSKLQTSFSIVYLIIGNVYSEDDNTGASTSFLMVLLSQIIFIRFRILLPSAKKEYTHYYIKSDWKKVTLILWSTLF